MSREGVAVKGRRLLTEARLVVRRAGPDGIAATCRGDSGEVYRVRWSPESSWTCSCPARGRRCSHVVALQLVSQIEEAN